MYVAELEQRNQTISEEQQEQFTSELIRELTVEPFYQQWEESVLCRNAISKGMIN